MLAESTTRFAMPLRRQRPMNPEPVAARFVTAHHPRRAPATRTAAAPCASARSTAAQIAHSRTVRSHGATPNPDVIASFQSFLPNSNATYNVGSLTLIVRAGRCDHHSLLLALNTRRSLIARPAHSLSVAPFLRVFPLRPIASVLIAAGTRARWRRSSLASGSGGLQAERRIDRLDRALELPVRRIGRREVRESVRDARLKAHDLLILAHRRRELALLQEQAPEVVVRPRSRPDLQRAPILGRGVVEPAGDGQRRAQVEMRGRRVGLQIGRDRK